MRPRSAHSDRAQSLNNLAALLDSQGDYSGAKPLYKRVLSIREKGNGSAILLAAVPRQRRTTCESEPRRSHLRRSRKSGIVFARSLCVAKKRQDKMVIQAMGVVLKSIKENLGLIFSRVCAR